MIQVDGIAGRLTAQNQSAAINASSLEGPLMLTNTSGSIHVTLDDDLGGDSEIRSDFGIVQVALDRNLDLLLTASTVGGSIKSDLVTATLDAKGTTSSAQLLLGSGNPKMKVTGNNATIILTEAR